MDEPFEIGIRIALDNGVAQAAPAIARELAMLDRAVAATEGRLAALRAPVAPAADVAVGRPAAVPVAPAEVSPGGSVSAPVTAVPPPATAPAPRQAPELAPAPLVPVAPAASPEPLPAPVAPPQIVLPLLPSPANAVPAAPENVARPQSAAPAAPLPVTAPTPALSLEVGRVEFGALRPGRVAPELPQVAPLHGQAAPDVPRPLAIAHPRAFADPPAAPVSAAPVVVMQAAAHLSRGVAPHEPAGDGASLSVAPAADAEPVTEGRLEIDGAAIGRWIAEHIGREMGRVPAGMTTADPRISPAWPGALQG